MIEWQWQGMEELVRKLREAERPERIKAAVLAGGLMFKRLVSPYPPASHRPQPFVSAKQRRGYFARLRAGEIEVPYRRGQSPSSESLKHRWAVNEIASGYGARITNDASYARLVHDRDNQAGYHRQTGWVTYQDVLEQQGDAIRDRVASEIVMSLKRIFGQ